MRFVEYVISSQGIWIKDEKIGLNQSQYETFKSSLVLQISIDVSSKVLIR